MFRRPSLNFACAYPLDEVPDSQQVQPCGATSVSKGDPHPSRKDPGSVHPCSYMIEHSEQCQAVQPSHSRPFFFFITWLTQPVQSSTIKQTSVNGCLALDKEISQTQNTVTGTYICYFSGGLFQYVCFCMQPRFL